MNSSCRSESGDARTVTAHGRRRGCVAPNGSRPSLGFGLGLRTPHYQSFVDDPPASVDWLEIVTENFLVPGGKPLYYLDRIRERYPLVMHGVSLSVGGCDALDMEYLAQVKALAHRIDARWVSDHLCWTGIDGHNLHDLLPLPYTDEAVAHVAGRVRRVQDVLGRRILLENVSSYVSYTDSAMTEWDFLNAVATEADCLILLDVNNIHVSAHNHHFDAMDYLCGVESQRVWQIHLAGHSSAGYLLVDTHDAAVSDPVWSLYGEAVKRLGPVSTMIERDADVPPLGQMVRELDAARDIASNALRARAS